MLARLSVSNLAIVESVEAEFSAGLNVLTGETGAGKSVLMGALELVLGGRSDPSMVREGAKEARVEAAFAVGPGASAVAETLDEAGLPPCEEGSLLVRRVVSASGGGRVWVNDAQTTVATLRRVGRGLVDIHGPRANQNILEERFQREALDAFSDLRPGRGAEGAYAAAWGAYVAASGKLESLRGEAGGEDEADMLRFQVGEFDEAALTAADEDLAARHAAAAHAEEIVSSANVLTEALGGDGGAAETLERLRGEFRSVARHFPAAESWAAEAEELTVRLHELSRTIADAASGFDVDPAEFAELDARLGVVNRLKRKYLKDAASGGEGGDVARLLAVLAAKRARLDDLENRDRRVADLEAEVAAARVAVAKAGAELTRRRAAGATKLAKAVTAGLRDLGFLQAKFSVGIVPREPEAHGCDGVEYRFEPNPGEPARPLAAIASSGETARVMLALKAALAAHDATDVLVFDEIDANIGGEVGRVVGEKMRAVAAHHQVIAITHLPQSAVFGARHLVVSKSVSGGRTRTRIAAVDGDERVREIARMLGGEKSTSVVKRHAEELLEMAR